MNCETMLTELRGVAAADHTGTFYVTFDDTHQCRLGLDGGRITHVSSFPMRGMAALRSLARRCPQGFHFAPGNAPVAHADLPDTQKILTFLFGQWGAMSAPAANDASHDTFGSDPVRVVAPGAGLGAIPAIRSVIERIAAHAGFSPGEPKAGVRRIAG